MNVCIKNRRKRWNCTNKLIGKKYQSCVEYELSAGACICTVSNIKDDEMMVLMAVYCTIKLSWYTNGEMRISYRFECIFWKVAKHIYTLTHIQYWIHNKIFSCTHNHFFSFLWKQQSIRVSYYSIWMKY